MFIAIEWVDWAGKDTQLKLLLSHLIDQNKHRVITKSREPSRMTDAGKKLNEIAQKHIDVSALETAKLFAEDRRELEIFRVSLLARDIWIISSRCDLTTYVYQGYASGVSFEEIYELHKDILAPELTIVLMISVDTMLARLGNRHEAKEVYEQEDFLRRCHAGYLSAIEFLRSKGRNIIVIDGEGSVDEVSERIKKHFI
jgi:dTMP kinase